MLVRNQIKTPDGTILRSRNRHDYVTYTDSITGKVYMVDGGLNYSRRNIHDDYEEQSVNYEDGHDICRTVDLWGTRGVDGNEPFRYISPAEMDDTHIKSILELSYISDLVRMVLNDEVDYRKNHSP